MSVIRIRDGQGRQIATRFHLQQSMLEWFDGQCDWTYCATINLLPTFRSRQKAEFVCRQFIRNFNRAIFGRRKSRYLKLAVLPIYADDRTPHIHFAFGGFPLLIPEYFIRDKFFSAARQTKGVQENFETKNSRLVRRVWIQSVAGYCFKHYPKELPSPRRWLIYILRFTESIEDQRHIMFDQLCFARRQQNTATQD